MSTDNFTAPGRRSFSPAEPWEPALPSSGTQPSPVFSSPAPYAGPGVLPLSDLRALLTLLELPHMSQPLLAALCRAFSSYQALASADPTHRAQLSGHPDAALLPAQLPYPRRSDHLPLGIHATTFSADDYPVVLAQLADQYFSAPDASHSPAFPILFYVGTLPPAAGLPASPAIGLVSHRYPTPTAVSVASLSGAYAAGYALPTVVLLSSKAGRAAAQAALEARGVVWAVVPSGLAHLSDTHLAADIVAAGGAVLSPFHWSTPPSPTARIQAHRLVVALSTAVVFASAPTPPNPDICDYANEALVLATECARSWGRPRIMPSPEDPTATRFGDLGLRMATADAASASNLFRAIVPPADVVCHSESDLISAFERIALTPRPWIHARLEASVQEKARGHER